MHCLTFFLLLVSNLCVIRSVLALAEAVADWIERKANN